MRIYYFGELIQDTNKNQTNIEQTTFNFDNVPFRKQNTGMDSIGDLLKELDLYTDSFQSHSNRSSNA